MRIIKHFFIEMDCGSVHVYIWFIKEYVMSSLNYRNVLILKSNRITENNKQIITFNNSEQ